MWVQGFPCGCEFSNLHFPDKMTRQKSCRHKRGGCKVSHVGASFPTCTSPTRWKSCRHKKWWLKVFPSHVGASFQLALPRQDGNLVATKRGRCKSSHPMWVRVFNLHFPDKMEILSPQRTLGHGAHNQSNSREPSASCRCSLGEPIRVARAAAPRGWDRRRSQPTCRRWPAEAPPTGVCRRASAGLGRDPAATTAWRVPPLPRRP